jgi:hypothetical protein
MTAGYNSGSGIQWLPTATKLGDLTEGDPLINLAHELYHVHQDKVQHTWGTSGLTEDEEVRIEELYAVRHENFARYAFYKKVPGFANKVVPRVRYKTTAAYPATPLTWDQWLDGKWGKIPEH